MQETMGNFMSNLDKLRETAANILADMNSSDLVVHEKFKELIQQEEKATVLEILEFKQIQEFFEIHRIKFFALIIKASLCSVIVDTSELLSKESADLSGSKNFCTLAIRMLEIHVNCCSLEFNPRGC